jgi:ABC-type Fe3+-siderophore transport system permease subunit
MWLVVAPAIVAFLSTSLFFICLTYIQPSFRNPAEYERMLGIRGTTLSWILCGLGTAMVCTFPWAMDNPPGIPLWVPQVGFAICLGIAQLALLRREARTHKRTLQEQPLR